MREFTVAIVEDEEKDSSLLKSYLEEFSVSRNVKFSIACFCSGEAFLTSLKRIYDIVFMDMYLGGMNGLEVSKRFREYFRDSVLIFVTNMASYAIKGYEVKADDFILKPLKYSLFESKLLKAVKRLSAEKKSVSVTVPFNNGVKVMTAGEIYYIDIVKHNMVYHTIGGNVDVYGSLSKAEAELSASGFVRCSSWCLVNLKHVEGLYGEDLHLYNGEVLHVSRSKKSKFLQALNTYCAEGRVK